MLAADVPGVLDAVEQQDALGVEPVALLRGLLEVVHGVTRAKAGGAEDPALSQEEREAYAEWASRMGYATLHRLWQLLLKGHGEVQAAPHPREAAEMALLRVVHASQLPDPGELARRLQAGEVVAAPVALTPPAPAAAPTPAPEPAAPVLPATPQEFHDMLVEKGARRLAACFEDARVIRFEPPEIMLMEHNAINASYAQDLQNCLNPRFGETGVRWTITVSQGIGRPSMREKEDAAAQSARDEILNAPMVAAVRSVFPGAELIDEVRSGS
jgi:DNA polymerase-3 subunit gamma/tau